MNDFERYQRYEQAMSLENRAAPAYERPDIDPYAQALLYNLENRFTPANVNEVEAALGYAHKEEAVVALGESAGTRAPQAVTVSVYHGEATPSALVITPSWSEATPDHMRSGWNFNSREFAVAQEALENENLDPETAALLQSFADEQADTLSKVAVSMVTAGAVSPQEVNRPTAKAN